MRYLVPHYYRKFNCAASECQDTCCAGWQITIDEASLKRYKHVRGSLGNRLHNSIDWKKSTFKQYHGHCVYLDENHLCDLYSDGGSKLLCRTCRLYPRHIEEFEGVGEISLSLSCIEAAKLILGCQEPVRFLTKEYPARGEMYEKFDSLLYTKLTKARHLILGILQNRTLTGCLRMSVALILAHDLQSRIERRRLLSIDCLLERFERPGAVLYLENKLSRYKITNRERYKKMKKIFQILSGLETLKKDWPDYVREITDTLYKGGDQEYTIQRTRFCEESRFDKEQRDTWDCWGEQLMVYFVFTYFCGAVYDKQVYGKMKLAVVSTVIIQEMAQAVWQQKGRLELDDIIGIAHRYSREIEHSDRNLNALEDLFMKEDLFDLENLLGVV